mmetsp:Transcript_760/g.1831  ORF Transcript_760/g.1831 Transcript_760/m.1831 type:complete len:275 (+) Transcript_760:83-907(+)
MAMALGIVGVTHRAIGPGSQLLTTRQPLVTTSDSLLVTTAQQGRLSPGAAPMAPFAGALAVGFWLATQRRGRTVAPRHSAGESEGNRPRIGVLFVCLGNICRSPTAEAVFRAAVERRGLADKFDIDSCGTGGGNPDWYKPVGEGSSCGWSYHEGDPADARMTAVAKERGVTLTSRSRPLRQDDFKRFDYILGMEESNIRETRKGAAFWGVLNGKAESKIGSLPSYCRKQKVNRVPDPWYEGSRESFEMVLDLVDDACEGLLDEICEKYGIVASS